jgi:H+/Cl- antiporter ClcA
MMNTFVRNNLYTIVGIVAGGVGGFLYWKFVGCYNGTCSITSKPLNSSLYGALMGGLLCSMFEKRKK